MGGLGSSRGITVTSLAEYSGSFHDPFYQQLFPPLMQTDEKRKKLFLLTGENKELPCYKNYKEGVLPENMAGEFLKKLDKKEECFCRVEFNDKASSTRASVSKYRIIWSFGNIIHYSKNFLMSKDPNIYDSFYHFLGRYMLLCATGHELKKK
jgi:hypothetical protein